MAKLNCICGKILSNNNCPSKDLIHIFSERKILESMEKNNSLTLVDFLYSSSVEFWFCHSCGRIYASFYEDSCADKAYRPIEKSIGSDELHISKWTRIFDFPDEEIDKTTESDPEKLLSSFYKEILLLPKSFISQDQSYLLLSDKKSPSRKQLYQLESYETTRWLPV